MIFVHPIEEKQQLFYSMVLVSIWRFLYHFVHLGQLFVQATSVPIYRSRRSDLFSG